MKIKYLGPRTEINVEPHGKHQMGEEKDYPDDFGRELIESSRKQRFVVTEGPEEDPSPEEILEATRKAIAAGELTGSGKPKTDAIAKFLGRSVSAAERDEALRKLEKGGE